MQIVVYKHSHAQMCSGEKRGGNGADGGSGEGEKARWEKQQQDQLAHSFGRLGRRGNMRDDSAEILFQSFLREAVVSSSDMGRDVPELLTIASSKINSD